jgi:chaperonin GroES
MLKPLNDYVVLAKAEAEKETKTSSGIILKADQDDRQVKAQILAVGPGVWVEGKRQALSVEVGQTVVFKSYSSTEVKLGEDTYLLVKESDILAIVEG